MDAIDTIINLRTAILKMTEELTIEQLNTIPAGFGNNIIWNLAHIVAAQQSVCYTRSGLPTLVDENFISAYKPGTKPEGYVEENKVSAIKALLTSTIDQLKSDYAKGIFNSYSSVTTRYGVVLGSVEDGINFIPFHDGFHMGYILALKRLL